MATWQTETQKVQNWVSSKFREGNRAMSDFFTGTISKKVDEVRSFFSNGATVVGINVGHIPAMQQAIRDYVNAIDSALGELKNYDPQVAFKGDEIVPALKQYIDAVKETCGAITSNMLAFNDQLTEVENAYKAKDTAAASTISSSAESTRSAYTRYTEQGGSTN